MQAKNEQILKLFLTALEIEEKGRQFYEQTAKASKNALGKKVFKMLAADELMHKKRIKTIYQSLNKAGEWIEDWKKFKIDPEASGKIFKELKEKHSGNLKVDAGDLAALEVGIGLEFASISFYQEQLNQAKDSDEKEFLEQIVKEEKMHHTLLSDMKLYLKDPSSWFIEKERHGLDGA